MNFPKVGQPIGVQMTPLGEAFTKVCECGCMMWTNIFEIRVGPSGVIGQTQINARPTGFVCAQCLKPLTDQTKNRGQLLQESTTADVLSFSQGSSPDAEQQSH